MERESQKTSPCTALVLAGGGARGAYQAGVLQGLAELGVLTGTRPGLRIFAGSSAGAINTSVLAASAGDLPPAVAGLTRLWSNIRATDVFRSDVASLGQTGAKWAWDLTFGGLVGGGTQRSLLDTGPLREFLARNIRFDRLEERIRSGALHALALSSTDLTSGNGVLFLQGNPDLPLWERRRWDLRRTEIGVDHVMASSAIPILFPSVEVEGRHYSDGSVRNTAPLSPAINLGAERILAISVREPSRTTVATGPTEAPSIARIAGVLLDAVMLDAVEVDVDHSRRVNRSVVSVEDGRPDRDGFRRVDILWMQPSIDISGLAAECSHNIPAVVRYLMRGLGSEESTTELASYLLFDAEFCRRLIDAGRADALASRDEIEAFFGPERGAAPA